MNRDIPLNKGEALADLSLPVVRKGKLDLVILRYMARRVYIALRSCDQATTTSQPLLYYLDERRRRIHRMAIYNPEELLLNNELAFVGFISGKLRPSRPSIGADLRIVDKKLVAGLVGTSGLLGYSSLELHDGNWCNLVLLNNPEVKIHLKNTETHRYAAYELAPSCYEWIRLHSGILPAGLAGDEMLLQKTRHYLYQGAGHRPTIREINYQET